MCTNFPETKILIIDDNSPDGTARLIKKLQKTFNNLDLIVRAEKDGVATAFTKGFQYGIENNYDYLACMDSDFSHQIIDLNRMFASILQNLNTT